MLNDRTGVTGNRSCEPIDPNELACVSTGGGEVKEPRGEMRVRVCSSVPNGSLCGMFRYEPDCDDGDADLEINAGCAID